MRFSSALLLALPALALAEDQVPILDKVKGYLNMAKDAISSAVPAAPSPLDAGVAKVASKVQHSLTTENWKQVLTVDPTASAPTTQDWMVFITGGNVTCYGFCGNASKAWNESVAALSATPKAPNFAVLDCESQPILCNSWYAGPPSIYYMQIPKPLADQSAPLPTVRFIPLNRTSVTGPQLTKLVTNKEYENTAPYEGPWHPFTGLLQQYNLAIPVGYVLWGFSKMPSWLPMILISFMSRSFM
ncbi:uncharacterized protein BDR25DRAFT_225292 [Lindgomyces ingoldianus]|uniref:Uncharacterized protein n=1 Tax=Lindgomyces ingoldianus TaxID=673940 RepID=A0ACB6QVP3_9PLEO|nr:uncharacterized protein BDR25DRAFT_225292 [Lindgomyces ingoldianus]KAF2470648.1 hypothetical protein BDR25DRAFT_225292 [Lindgomyces ingoldianus]